MKQYVTPEITVTELRAEDVITTSSFTLSIIELDDEDALILN